MGKTTWLDVKEWKSHLDTGLSEHVAVRKAMDSEVVPIPGSGRRIQFTISTGDVDRDGDFVSPKGWALDNYRKNPVVMWAHDYAQLPIAKTLDIEVKGDKLVATAEFATKEMNPLADSVYQMLKGGFLNSSSVGFKPIDFTYNEQRKGVDFKRQELLEFSVVPIPSNPGSLVEARAVGIDTAPLLVWAKGLLTASIDKASLAVPTDRIPPEGTAKEDEDKKTSKEDEEDEDGIGVAADEDEGEEEGEGDGEGEGEKKPEAKKPWEKTGASHIIIKVPQPGDESEQEYVSRCMGDEEMRASFEDAEQRAAVCYSTYRRHKALRAKASGIEHGEAGCALGQLCPKPDNGPCPMAEGCPMHGAGKAAPATRTKIGRVLSAANERTLKEALRMIETVLSQVATPATDETVTAGVSAENSLEFDLLLKSLDEGDAEAAVDADGVRSLLRESLEDLVGTQVTKALQRMTGRID